MLSQEKVSHVESLKTLHEKLDPHGSITGIEDPAEILALIQQIVDIYIEKLQESDQQIQTMLLDHRDEIQQI